MCLCLVLATGGGAAALVRGLEQAHLPKATAESVPWLPPASAMRVASLGYHGLAADLFWLRAVQYFGERYQTNRRFPHLYRLVDLATSLDPRFVEAYRFGALFLSIGRAFPEAIAIYRKGMEHNPHRWDLPYELGRMYFLDLGDIPAALECLERARTLPGHAAYVPRMVAYLRSRAGLVEAAIEMWQQIYETTDNQAVRRRAMEEVRRLRARRGRPAPNPPPGGTP
jgi:tetratricopeptide (TPR) repeat protein